MPHVDLDEFGGRLVGWTLFNPVLQFGVVEPQGSCNLADGIEWGEVNGALPQMLGDATARLAGATCLFGKGAQRENFSDGERFS
jgi:hypothetical protein